MAHVGEFAYESASVDVGRSQHHIVDFRRNGAVAERHLPQCFEREKIAHGMGKNVNVLNRRIADEHIQ